MIDFLYNTGLNNDIVKKMNDTYDETNLFNLSCNEDECIKIINLMKQIGIKIDIIESLLVIKLDWFLNTCDEIINILRKTDILEFINRINNDPFVIEEYC